MTGRKVIDFRIADMIRATMDDLTVETQLTVAQLAMLLGVSRTMIYQYLNGNVKPSRFQMQQLAVKFERLAKMCRDVLEVMNEGS